MSKKNKDSKFSEKELIKQSEYYKGHSAEFTRRQFLYNSGLMGLATYIGFSNLPKLFIPTASAEDVVAKNLAYVGIECAGGINFAGNIIVGRDNSGTQNEHGGLDGYIIHGLPPELHPSMPNMIDTSYGLHFHKTSGILKGMDQVLKNKTVSISGVETPIKDMVDGVAFLCRSTDDTNSNNMNSTIAAVKAGAKGVLVNLVGSKNSPAGGRHACDPVVYDPKMRPPIVNSEASAKSLLSLGANTYRNISNNSHAKFMDKIASLARERLNLISQSRLSPTARENLKASIASSSTYFDRFSAAALTPSLSDSATLNTVFPNIAPSNVFEANLSLDKNLIGTIGYLLFHSTAEYDSLVGAATIEVPGCDYHNGTAETGVLKDMEIGRYIGELIYYAALKGKSLVIDLSTDGSAVGGDAIIDETPLGQGRIVLRTDSPVSSGSMMLVYNHGKTRLQHPIVVEKNGNVQRQVGYFLNVKNGGTDLTANGLANNTNHLWKIKMLNYISLMNSSSDPEEIVHRFEEIYGRGLLPTDAKNLIRMKYLG